MIEERKRINNYKQLLEAYAGSCHKIVHKHQTKMAAFTETGVQTMQSLFQGYEMNKKNLVECC